MRSTLCVSSSPWGKGHSNWSELKSMRSDFPWASAEINRQDTGLCSGGYLLSFTVLFILSVYITEREHAYASVKWVHHALPSCIFPG